MYIYIYIYIYTPLNGAAHHKVCAELPAHVAAQINRYHYHHHYYQYVIVLLLTYITAMMIIIINIFITSIIITIILELQQCIGDRQVDISANQCLQYLIKNGHTVL